MPVALLTSQFQKQVDGNPGLLRFYEVVNLFHEFMHVVSESLFILLLIHLNGFD